MRCSWFLSCALALSNPKCGLPDKHKPYLIAHRGGSLHHRQSSISAYKHTTNMGLTDMLECDVTTTSDGVLLCAHSPDFQRVSDPSSYKDWFYQTLPRTKEIFEPIIDQDAYEDWYIPDYTWRFIQQLSGSCPKGTTECRHIPDDRLARVADLIDLAYSKAASSRPVGLYLETKHQMWHSSIKSVDLITSLIDLLRIYSPDLRFPFPVFLQSFEYPDLVRLRNIIGYDTDICLVALIDSDIDGNLFALDGAPNYNERLNSTSDEEIEKCDTAWGISMLNPSWKSVTGAAVCQHECCGVSYLENVQGCYTPLNRTGEWVNECKRRTDRVLTESCGADQISIAHTTVNMKDLEKLSHHPFWHSNETKLDLSCIADVIAPRYQLLEDNEKLASQILESGMQLHVWTVNDPDVMNRAMLKFPWISGFITDDCAGLDEELRPRFAQAEQRTQMSSDWSKFLLPGHNQKYLFLTCNAKGDNKEVMGILFGTVVHNTFYVVDSVALPVRGSETRVTADCCTDEWIVNYTNQQEKKNSKVYPIGWYHTHPGYKCWLSNIDIETHRRYQKSMDPWVAVVLDPTNQNAIEMGAFRLAEDSYMAKRITVPQTSKEENAYYSIPIQIQRNALLGLERYRLVLDIDHINHAAGSVEKICASVPKLKVLFDRMLTGLSDVTLDDFECTYQLYTIAMLLEKDWRSSIPSDYVLRTVIVISTILARYTSAVVLSAARHVLIILYGWSSEENLTAFIMLTNTMNKHIALLSGSSAHQSYLRQSALALLMEFADTEVLHECIDQIITLAVSTDCETTLSSAIICLTKDIRRNFVMTDEIVKIYCRGLHSRSVNVRCITLQCLASLAVDNPGKLMIIVPQSFSLMPEVKDDLSFSTNLSLLRLFVAVDIRIGAKLEPLLLESISKLKGKQLDGQALYILRTLCSFNQISKRMSSVISEILPVNILSCNDENLLVLMLSWLSTVKANPACQGTSDKADSCMAEVVSYLLSTRQSKWPSSIVGDMIVHLVKKHNIELDPLILKELGPRNEEPAPLSEARPKLCREGEDESFIEHVEHMLNCSFIHGCCAHISASKYCCIADTVGSRRMLTLASPFKAASG